MFGLGMPELIIIFALVLIVFGPGRLPQIGKALGNSIINFKDSFPGKDKGKVAGTDGDSTVNSSDREDTSGREHSGS